MNSTRQIAAGVSGPYTLTTRKAPGAVDACEAQTFTLPITATASSNA